VVCLPVQQPEKVDLLGSSLGTGVDLRDPGGGAETHGNPAWTGFRSYGSNGSECAGNSDESGDGRVGENYRHFGGNVFVPEPDSGLVSGGRIGQGL